jgi:hypothetical protein
MDEALSLLPGSKMPIRKASEEATGMTHQDGPFNANCNNYPLR